MKKLFNALSLVLMLSMILTTVVIASDLDIAVIDIDTTLTEVTLAPGGSANIEITMTVTGRQAESATFKVYKDWTLSGGSFSGANAVLYTVPARVASDSATEFTLNGTVTVAAGQADGTFTLAISAFDIISTGQAKLEMGDPSTFDVIVEGTAPPAKITPTLEITNSPVTYNGTPQAANIVAKDGIVAVPGAVSNVMYSGSAIAPTNAGTYAVTADFVPTDGTTYASLTGASAGNFVIDKALLTVTADDKEIYFGDPLPAFTFQYSGFLGTDTAADIDTPPTCNVTGTPSAVGTYDIVCSGGLDNNYDFIYVKGTLEIKAWTLYGFYRPVDMGEDVWNTIKGGQTVPLKFNIWAGDTELTSTDAVSSFTVTPTTCPVGFEFTSAEVEFTTTGGTSLRYDFTDGQFIQNWKTPKVRGCYLVTMTTMDGSTLEANFLLK